MIKRIALLLIFANLFSQEIDWKEKPSPITAIHIFCDTENIPIYVDGLHIGASPVKDPVQVAPGWHQVSYFPPQTMVNTHAILQNKKMRDMIKLARQDVLVEKGKTVRVVLSYRSIEAEALEYDRKFSSSSWVGLGMVFVTFGLIVWGLM
jgi:hypothetical protein